MGGHGHSDDGPSGGHSGMRRRPIDHTRKLPLIRSQKELALDDDTKVDAEQVRLPFGTMLAAHVPGRRRSQPPNGQQPCPSPLGVLGPSPLPPLGGGPRHASGAEQFFCPTRICVPWPVPHGRPARPGLPAERGPACRRAPRLKAAAALLLLFRGCHPSAATPPPFGACRGPAGGRSRRCGAAVRPCVLRCAWPAAPHLRASRWAWPFGAKRLPVATAPCDDATDE
jgi:hypothetical protein